MSFNKVTGSVFNILSNFLCTYAREGGNFTAILNAQI